MTQHSSTVMLLSYETLRSTINGNISLIQAGRDGALDIIAQNTAKVEVTCLWPRNDMGEEPMEQDTLTCAFHNRKWRIDSVINNVSLP